MTQQPPKSQKPLPKRTVSSSQLQLTKTLSKVSPAEMNEARQIMEAEKQKFIQSEESLAPPRPSQLDSDVEDIKKTGEIAVRFNRGLDKVQDALLLLILKFGRASNMMRASLLGLGIAILILFWCVFLFLEQKNEIRDILGEMKKIQVQQEQVVSYAIEAKKQANAAAKQAAEAKEAAPKVVLAEDGKAKLLVSGEDLKKRFDEKPPKPVYKKTTPPKVTSKGVEFDLGLP